MEGDSPQRLVGKVNMRFPDKFMYEQMQKVEYLLQPKGCIYH